MSHIARPHVLAEALRISVATIRQGELPGIYIVDRGGRPVTWTLHSDFVALESGTTTIFLDIGSSLVDTIRRMQRGLDAIDTLRGAA